MSALGPTARRATMGVGRSPTGSSAGGRAKRRGFGCDREEAGARFGLGSGRLLPRLGPAPGHARGVAGHALNLNDGRVELEFEGDEAAVEALVDWAHRVRRGPT